MDNLTLTAYAKLNLTMEVLNRRPDGYHTIRSLMQFISLGDRVELRKTGQFSFWCSDPALGGADNLAVRAWQLLARDYPVGPVAIRLWKETPCMSGMGGGSADAAAVLHGLNDLFGLGLSLDTLCRLGGTLGADVPACLHGGTLLAQGIGEKITPIPVAGTLWYCVVKPDVAFSTPDMYRRMDEAAAFDPPADLTAAQAALAAGDPQGIASQLRNSFMAVAQPLEPLETALNALKQTGALGAGMTGAGSAVFGVYAGQAAAQTAFEQLQKQGHTVWCCRSL